MLQTHHPPTSRTVIAVSLVVGLGLAIPSAPAFANDLGEVATSTMSYSSVDTTSGIITGGTPQQYEPAHGGWRGPAFSEFGRFGLERTVSGGIIQRNAFSAWNEAVTLEQGATTTMTLSSQIITDSLTRNIAQTDITLQGNSIRQVISLEELWDGSLPRMRFYLHADLAAGANVEYESLNSSSLLITDSSGQATTTLIHAAASHGTASFANQANNTVVLANGNSEMALYVDGFSAAATTITIYTFLLDADPCADAEVAELASTIAANPSGYFGGEIETASACLAANDFVLSTVLDEPATLSIDVDPTVVTPEGSTRRFVVAGEPTFVSATMDDQASPATITVDYIDTAVAGEYPLTLRSWLETTIGGATTRSQPMSEIVSLTLTEPIPEPEPEPLPEPEAEPEPEVVVEVSDVTQSGSRDRDRNDEDQLVVVTDTAGPPIPQRQVEAPSSAPEEVVPDFQLQESAPATPLPETAPSESVVEMPPSPTTNIWATWWLWVIGGLSLIWWAWLGWSSQRSQVP